MIQNEERLQLVLEANNKASAVLAQVRRDIEATRGSTTQLNQSTAGYEVSANKVRTGAIAFSTVARAAQDARMGTQGAIVAASRMAETLALVSRNAKFAAMSGEIGMVVLALGTMVSLLRDTNDELDKITVSPAMKRLLEDAKLGQVNEYISGLQARQQQLVADIANNQKSAAQRLKNGILNNPLTEEGRSKIFGTGESDAQQQREKQLAQVTADLDAALTQRSDLRRAAHRKEVDDSIAKARQLAEQAVSDGKTATELYTKLGNDRVLIWMRSHDKIKEMEELQADIDLDTQEKAIKKLLIAEEKRNELIEAARKAHAERIAEIESAAEKKALQQKQQVVGGLVHAMIQAQGPLMKQLKRLALEPIAGELEGLAISEGVKVITSWPNAIAMAKHAAGAAAAIAGARAVYGLAGGGGGGGGGGAGGGGGVAGAGTFEPRDNGQGGSAVINLYTTNPYGREQIQQVKYELDRAGVMKRPAIEIPPTTGIRTSH